MKKNYFLTLLLGLFVAVGANAQFDKKDVKFWIGSGADSSVLVIDFKDGSQDSSYAWGYIYDADTLTLWDMIEAVSEAEPNFTYVTSGVGFLESVTFNTHTQSSGATWWSIWSGEDFPSMVLNGSGLNEVLADGGWYGATYGFSPEPTHPATPWAAYSSLWFDKDEISFWVGSGADSAVMVIDFVESEYGAAPTFAFGVKFNGSITGAQMLSLLDAADVNLSVNMATYLNDIVYNDLEGIAANPGYWSTYSGTDLSDWTYNAGISTTVTNGGWFGCAYGGLDTRRPFIPIPANDPRAVTIDDVASWVGTGADSAVIVIDFNDGINPESFAFGYLFNGTATGKDALMALDNSLSTMTVAFGSGYLNDITYLTHTGIGGTGGFYWGTWSARNNGNWTMNNGVNTALINGDWFGCSFTDFSPALPPSTPAIAPSTAGLNETTANAYSVYPNPVKDVLNIQGAAGNLTIADVTGKVVYSAKHAGFSKVDLSGLNAGMYMVSIESKGIVSTRSVVK